MHNYTIETDRLILRPLTAADAEAAFLWTSDPEVNRFMAYPRHTDIEQTREWLRSVEEAPESDLDFGFVSKSDGLLIGSGGAYRKDDGSWMVGYNFRRDCWGQGYAAEAIRTIIDFAHNTLGASVFVGCHAIGNPASGRVMEKCGMVFDHFGEYSKLDGSVTFQTKCYRLKME